MAGGRPRIHDKDAIAKALLEWAAKEDSINLNGFCVSLDPPIPPQYITRFADECEGFREAYNTAKAWLGERRERKLKNGELHVKAYDLNAAVYDYYLKKEKREDREHEAKTRRENEHYDPELAKQAMSMMNQLRDAQDEIQSLKAQLSKYKSESKS